MFREEKCVFCCDRSVGTHLLGCMPPLCILDHTHNKDHAKDMLFAQSLLMMHNMAYVDGNKAVRTRVKSRNE